MDNKHDIWLHMDHYYNTWKNMCLLVPNIQNPWYINDRLRVHQWIFSLPRRLRSNHTLGSPVCRNPVDEKSRAVYYMYDYVVGERREERTIMS